MDYYSSKNNFFQNKEDSLLLSPRKISFKYLSIVLVYRPNHFNNHHLAPEQYESFEDFILNYKVDGVPLIEILNQLEYGE